MIPNQMMTNLVLQVVQKPEDTQLTIEEAKAVFTRGKRRPKSVLTLTDAELKVFQKKKLKRR